MPRTATVDARLDHIGAVEKRLRQLAASVEGDSLSNEEFFTRWLKVVGDAAFAGGGIVRLRNDQGRWNTAASANFPTLKIGSEHEPARHGRLIFEAFVTGRPKIIPPQTGERADAEANPTTGLLLMAPLTVRDEVRGVVELVLPPDCSADKQLEILAVLQAAAESVDLFERQLARRLRTTREQIAENVETFCRQVYRDLSVDRTAYAIANEAKRLLGAERVSVLMRRGKFLRLEAVSGLDVVEKRSAAAKEMAAMAEAVNAGLEPVHYPSLNSESPEPLAPQLQQAVGGYVDHSYVRRVSVLPLIPSLRNAEKKTISPPALGALVVEWFGEAKAPDGYVDRCRFAVEHATSALQKARQHESLPGVKLWQRVVDWRETADPKKAAWLGVPLVALVALVIIPADFTIHSTATLRPALNQYAFAPSDGVVKELYVKHGDRVAVGQPLLQLHNVDLEVQLTELAGRRRAAQEQLSGVERSLYEDSTRIPVTERHRLSGERSKLRQELAAYDEQLRLLHRKKEQLLVRSPLAGEILSWDVEKLLLRRPVQIGQSLLEIGDVAGAWTLEMEVPDDDVGHVAAAAGLLQEPLAVRYRLAASPQKDYFAAVQEVHLAADVRGEAGNVVLVRAALDDSSPPILRAGTAAVAKIYCGRRSLGYVWLHDAIDFLRTKVWFRLS
ncbi:MAG: efflux RND transporter periplasmic adaptor subunit [Pirellulales bacterium]